MNLLDNGIRSQLAPGWSGVNIAILVVLLILFFPLGLLMLGYILAGQTLGLDLSRPETFVAKFERLRAAFSAGIAEFNHEPGQQPAATQNPVSPVDPAAPEPQADYERDRLRRDRESLDAERRQFEAEKRAFYENRTNS